MLGVLLVFVAAVAIPAACVLWFMGAAMDNVRSAVRERLTETYRSKLDETRERLDAPWRAKLDAVAEATSLSSGQKQQAPGDTFAGLVHTGLADSVIVCDDAGGVLYPDSAIVHVNVQNASADWTAANELEYEAGSPLKAAEAYGRIVAKTTDVNEQARALQGQVRCLLKAERKADAIKLVAGPLRVEKYKAARDASGRLILPDCMLMALEMAAGGNEAAVAEVKKELLLRVMDYSDGMMGGRQRLFLMERLVAMKAVLESDLKTLAAERLAARVRDGQWSRPEGGVLAQGADGIWRLGSSRGGIVLLFADRTVLAAADSMIPNSSDVPGARVVVHRAAEPDSKAFLSIPAGEHMPGWRLELYLEDGDPFAAASDQQAAAYVVVAVACIGAIASLAVVLAGYLRRQLKLTRLKNDLIATVSHELKTPLASMRVLVDTLLDGRCEDEAHSREYLTLISKENERLSRLIDNFLTFSRMERNKRAFEFSQIQPGSVIAAAAAVARERLSQPGCYLDVQCPDSLPEVDGDGDALVTVLVNLLDNAWKYTADEKHVTLRAWADDGKVHMSVSDNGIGMSRRAIRKVFERFYQVDQTLSRTAEGCGLGLSIVKFIIDAHNADIDVTSRLGEGSTFTVTMRVSDGDEEFGDNGQRDSSNS